MFPVAVFDSHWRVLERLWAAPISLRGMLRLKGTDRAAFWLLVEQGHLSIAAGGDDMVVNESGQKLLRGCWVINPTGAREWRQLSPLDFADR